MIDYKTWPAQVWAARALLGWSQAELARRSSLSVTVIARIETGGVDVRLSTYQQLMDTLQDAGIEFLSENGGYGVMLNR